MPIKELWGESQLRKYIICIGDHFKNVKVNKL